jgi:hypothetical protein
MMAAIPAWSTRAVGARLKMDELHFDDERTRARCPRRGPPTMPRLPLCAACLLATLCSLPTPFSLADVVYDDVMHALGQYAQDFNGLPTANQNSYFNGDANVQLAIPGENEFDGARIAGSSTSNAHMLANTGALGTAGMYSVGSDADRALGAQASSLRSMAFGFSLLNSVAVGEITEIKVEFYQETWRVPSTSTNTVTAAWGTSSTAGVTTSNYLSVGGLTTVSALNLVQAPSAAAAGVDGNLAPYRILRTFTFSNLDLDFGERFYLRWQDVDEAGDDATLAIDDLKLSFTHSASVSAVPESSSLMLVAAAGVLARWAKRRDRTICRLR